MVSTVAESLRKLRLAEPFSPFELILHDGRHIAVRQPEHVGWQSEHDLLSFAAEDDSFEHLKLSQIVGVRPVAGAGTGMGG